jgi:hypothetical protein
MKTKTSILFLFLMHCFLLNGQTIMDVSRSNSITWYGIDFSAARFIKFENVTSPENVRENLIPNWFRFTARTNFSSKYHIPRVNIDTSTCIYHNSQIDPKTLFSNSYYEINNETIEKIINSYKTNGDGYGFLYIVESIEKSTEKVYVYVCYFNEKDHKIISMRRYIGKASGFGVENHFTNGINEIITNSSKDFKKYSKH